ncbi:MmcQ/YjbR family DNA-binding protein [Paracoccus sp. TK19116]|uniref:MmcQ/YjbR family DNA-binding protein n=1 Tax=Paracoccus albicereus TaxID=2922394 RepID=A0ABT1MP00_9RHOB|nr:MmcQ/YjbR family DNA-binding protein [Paracoccus albicereus]MCQ0970020.1 MmcQ/YjbR family DNA-binding protein [Paracoccus albicereus]
MTRKIVHDTCSALPGAEWSDPWGGGHDCWKVGGKIFAVTGSVNAAVAVKTEGIDQAEMLIAAGPARRASYFHRSWVELPLDTPADELQHRIRASYGLIRATLPKKVQAALDPV